MRAFWLTLLCSVCFLLGKAQQEQRIVVQGIIIDKDAQHTIAGITVRSKLGNSKTKTDQEGRFSLTGMNRKDSVIVSGVGYTTVTVSVDYFFQKEPLGMKHSDQYLNIVEVNTGYQTLKPNEVTGAVGIITEDMLKQQTGTNIMQRLNNMVPAVRFDNQPIQNPIIQKLNVSIRGLSTINGQMDPLIVLDGFIYEGNIANIDPNSVESVSILKDAAAAAIWGARAGNGVIVLTSKKGKLGTNERSKISFNSTFLFNQNSDLTQLYRMSNQDFIGIEKMLFDKGYYNVFLNSVGYAAMTPVIDILDKRKKELISSLDSAKLINNLLLQDGLKNYADAFYERPFTQQYNLNISGGGAKHAYGFATGYTTDKSQLNDRNRKINLLFSNTFKPISKLQIDVAMNYTNAISKSGRPDLTGLTYNGKSVPYLQFVDDKGLEIPFERDFRQLYVDQKYRTGFLDWSYYPMSEYKYSNTASKLTELYATFGLAYQVRSFLKLSLSGQYQLQSIKGETKSTLESYDARSTINKYIQMDANGKLTYPVPQSGLLRNSNTDGQSYTIRGQGNVDKRFGTYHIVGILGAEIRENNQKGNSFTAYGYNDLPLAYAPVDYVTLFKTNPDDLYQNILGAPDFSKTVNRYISTFANFSTIWKEKYAISASLRQDGANIFGALTNDKWSPLWSVGGFWEVGKEQFMKRSWIDMLKLRATYGYSGNVDVSKTPQPVANVQTDSYTKYRILNISKLNDPSLRWEKVGTINFGLDYSFFNGRISGAIDYYVKSGNDLYGSTEYDYTTWGASNVITKNVASMKGKGLDMSITSKNTLTGVKWDTRLNLSTNSNRTTAYYQSLNQGVLNFLGNGNKITPLVGMPLNAIAAYRWAGLNEQGIAQGYVNGEKSTDYSKIRSASVEASTSDGSIRFFGSAKPQVFGNLINSFSWHEFSLGINVSFKADYYFLKPATSYFNLFQSGNAYPDFEDRWQKEGDELRTNTPKMSYPLVSSADAFYTQSEIHVLKGDHIRLEYVNFSWQKAFDQRRNKMNVRLYGNFANLGILWRSNSHKIDPEYPYRLSPPKVFSLGIQINY
ncbi:SusC/RagA family TonB-linked outer membrane protein [Sphingobacterium sp. UBA2074]|uniref:SusC/RagA family TonB-linked outer membrane protein n=1 Tax=Sphingobacterium sp. UBA2074 TaxID=1947487 RepID=UPI00257D905F|nr:SusC/RagA family TonB-linked outer membrane protein [Sphingobacterium sp. UBA2074]